MRLIIEFLHCWGLALKIRKEVRAQILLRTLMNKDTVIFIAIFLFLKIKRHIFDSLFNNIVDFADPNLRYLLFAL